MLYLFIYFIFSFKCLVLKLLYTFVILFNFSIFLNVYI